jgi:hypothetical protein
MKKIFNIFSACTVAMLFALTAGAQITHRDLLEKYLIPTTGGNLLAQKDWKPFPKSAEE